MSLETRPKRSRALKSSSSPSRSPLINQPLESADRIFSIWDELQGFPAEQTGEALQQLGTRLRKILRADDLKWVAAVRVLDGEKAMADRLDGWRLRALFAVKPLTAEYLDFNGWWFQKPEKLTAAFPVGHAAFKLIEGFGKFQCHLMRDGWIPWAEFRTSEHYRTHYTNRNVTDRMWLSYPLADGAESLFLIDRHGKTPHFTKDDLHMATTVVRGIGWFHRRLLLSQGLLVSVNPLTPVERKILQKLLTSMSEKEIATSVRQNVSTTHKYIKKIFAHFGVNGRAGLMAFWLGA